MDPNRKLDKHRARRPFKYTGNKLDNLRSFYCKLINQKQTRAGHVKTAGGSATEVIAIDGVKAVHKCGVSLTDLGAVPVKVLTSKCGLNKITVVFDADPSNDHELDWFITK